MRAKKILYVLIFSLLFFSGSVVTQAQQGGYDEITIVFLVDQSESMGRVNGGMRANDTLGLRFYAPWYAMYWMGEDRLLVHDNVIYRMAVINFGDTAETWNFGGTQWQTINADSRNEWEPIYQSLTDQIEFEMRDEYSKDDLNGTNLLNGFQAAQQAFAALPSATGNRLHVIIVLTDGQPSDPTDPNFSTSEHMNRINQFASQYFREPDYRIYVIGMIDASSEYWPRVESEWEDITNDPCTAAACPDPTKDRTSLVESNDDVGKRFEEIFRDLSSEFTKPAGVTVIDKVIGVGDLDVPPYLESISFTYFKADLDEHLVITDANGNLFDPNSPGVTIEGLGGPIEVVRIANPEPGMWKIETNPQNPGVDITMRQIFAQSRLDSPSGEQVQYVPINIQYGLLDDQGSPLVAYADPYYTLAVTATISSSGQNWPMQLSKLNDVYVAEFTPVTSGDHSIYVRAASKDLSGNPIVVFDGEIGRFPVSPASLVPKNISSDWAQYEEGLLTFGLQDAQGQPIQTAAPLDITVSISGEASQPLTVEPQDDGTYQVAYTPLQTGQHTVRVMAKITDSSGTVHTVADAEVAKFDVALTTLVDIRLVAPTETSQLDTSLFFKRTPVILEIQLEDDAGNPLDPASVFSGDPNTALLATVTDQDREDFSDLLVLEPTKQRGLYRAETTELKRGNYTIAVEALGNLQDGYLYRNREDGTSLERTRHPAHLPILYVTIALVLIIAAIIAFLVNRAIQIRKHPCNGELYIVDSDGSTKFRQNLTPINRNRIKLTTPKDIHPITHVRQMVIECKSDPDSQAGRVTVSIWLDKDRVPNQKLMGRNGEFKLGSYDFWLLKDPSEEQLMQNRGTNIDQDYSFDSPSTTTTETQSFLGG